MTYYNEIRKIASKFCNIVNLEILAKINFQQVIVKGIIHEVLNLRTLDKYPQHLANLLFLAKLCTFEALHKIKLS